MSKTKPAAQDVPGDQPGNAPAPEVAAPQVPTTEQLAQSPNWGQGGSYIINQDGERVLANQE